MDKAVHTMRRYLEFTKEPLLAVLTALMVIQFIAAHTRIPTGSMIPTIQINDHMIVNRMPYYYKNPQRGEIVVFEEGDIPLVKRVIGLPGEQINIIEGKVYIDEVLLEEAYLPVGTQTEPFFYSDVKFPLMIPEGEYFVMGDNRGNSQDSRYFGTIKRDSISAQGGFRIFPFHRIGWVK
jgi:signal peptidase I